METTCGMAVFVGVLARCRMVERKGHARRLSPATILKEIVTLRTAWNWGVRMKLIAGRFPPLPRWFVTSNRLYDIERKAKQGNGLKRIPCNARISL